MRRLNPRVLAAAAIGLLVLIAAVLMLTRQGSRDQDKLSEEQAAGKSTGPEKRCASQRTYDRIKSEIFRQAAQVRKSDSGAFDKLASYASVRVESPLLRAHDAELGTVRCTGRLSIDLPPGVAVVGGRRSLSADVDYVLQPAADGSGDVVMLEGADPIIVPLATLARTGETAPTPPEPAPPADQPPASAPAGPMPSAPPPAAREPAPVPVPAPVATATAKPSFNCRYARTRGEIAVCRDSGLAALDRQMAAQYYRALAAADARQRATLTSTRDSFLRYRDRCPSDSCIAETYRGRMREIRDIMSGDWRP